MVEQSRLVLPKYQQATLIPKLINHLEAYPILFDQYVALTYTYSLIALDTLIHLTYGCTITLGPRPFSM